MKELLGEELYKENLPYIQRVLSGEQVMFEQKLQQVDGSKHQTLVHYIPTFKENKVVSFTSGALNNRSIVVLPLRSLPV